MNEPARIPIDVLEGLRFVQASGDANMFDVTRVAQFALRAGYTRTADWLVGEENREAYVRGVLYGFPSEGEQGRAGVSTTSWPASSGQPSTTTLCLSLPLPLRLILDRSAILSLPVPRYPRCLINGTHNE